MNILWNKEKIYHFQPSCEFDEHEEENLTIR